MFGWFRLAKEFILLVSLNYNKNNFQLGQMIPIYNLNTFELYPYILYREPKNTDMVVLIDKEIGIEFWQIIS